MSCITEMYSQRLVFNGYFLRASNENLCKRNVCSSKEKNIAASRSAGRDMPDSLSYESLAHRTHPPSVRPQALLHALVGVGKHGPSHDTSLTVTSQTELADPTVHRQHSFSELESLVKILLLKGHRLLMQLPNVSA